MKLIQDFAGENSPVAPFSKSTPKDKYAILIFKYDDKGKLYAIVYEDYVAYKGEKIDYAEYMYLKRVDYRREQYIYGKAGNLWKIHESYCRDGEWKYHNQKLGRKFQKTDDVYVQGYLKERQFVGEKSKQSFNYAIDYFKRGCIYFEWVDEKEDVAVRILERYDDANLLISQQTYEVKLSDPADCWTNEMQYFHYSTNTITKIDRFSNDNNGMYIAQTHFSDFDTKGNWLKNIVYEYKELGGEEKLVHSESREIAYDEATAHELKAKFDSLVAESSVEHEF